MFVLTIEDTESTEVKSYMSVFILFAMPSVLSVVITKSFWIMDL